MRKQTRALWPTPPCPLLPFVCRKVLARKTKFNQRSEKKKKQRVKRQTGQNINSLVIKQSQGLLVPPEG